jgi:biotin carboxylase
MRLLLCATTTGYQTRAFEQIAQALDIDLVYATDRCHVLDDPWRDRAIPVRFSDERASLDAIVAAARPRGFAGVLAVGDRPACLAALAAYALGLPWHSPTGVRAATDKLLTRGRLLASGLPAPWFVSLPLADSLPEIAPRLRFPCVVKPLALSGSRGVIRANDVGELEVACARVRGILETPPIRAERNPAHDQLLIEGFIEGREIAVEGVLERGALRVLAIFDKPDPLDGPFFEETIYVTPSSLPDDEQRRAASVVARAAHALGLFHGPIHAECRLNPGGVFVLEVAPRPIGGLCARALRFASREREGITLEEVLLRHACGERLDGFRREASAAGVMMMPVPRAGRLQGVDGVEQAEQVPGVESVVVTAKRDELLMPLPEGSSYPGFIFARAGDATAATAALRAAHQTIRFDIAPPVAMARGDKPASDD